MKLYTIFSTITALWISLTAVNSAQAATTEFRCVTCHQATASVLPAKHIAKKDFFSCFSCHATGQSARSLAIKVHRIHLAGSTDSATCLSCHPTDAAGNLQIHATAQASIKKSDLPDMANRMGSWLKSDKLAYAHQRKGVSCQACHTAYGEDDPYMEKCVACHGDYDAMAKKTAGTKLERNPHKSHYPTLKCTNCHQSHDAFKNFCATCHGFAFIWKLK